MLEMRKGMAGAKQSGQDHRLQKALASCVQTGGGPVYSLRTGGRRGRWSGTGTLARKARGRRRRGGVGGGAEGQVPGLPLQPGFFLVGGGLAARRG